MKTVILAKSIVVRSDADLTTQAAFGDVLDTIKWDHVEDAINDQLPDGFKAKIED